VPRYQQLEREVKNLLVGQGFNEVINFSFASQTDIQRLQFPASDRRQSAVALLNPLVDEHAVMRTSLLPALLQTAARNISVRNLNLRLFEMRRVYLPREEAELPHEPLHVAGIMTGQRDPEGWNQTREQVDFFDVKGVVETLAAALKLPELTFRAEGVDSFYHPGKACAVLAGAVAIGSLGEIHPDVQESFALEKKVYYFELDFAALVELGATSGAIAAPSRFPDTFRDIALLLGEDISSAQVVGCITGQKIDKITRVEIFDVYTGDKIPAGQKSIAVRVRYGANDRTLTDEEVNKLHQKVINGLTAKLPVTIR
jgi:phenylalanyl-tRNA synthetase beta chain